MFGVVRPTMATLTPSISLTTNGRKRWNAAGASGPACRFAASGWACSWSRNAASASTPQSNSWLPGTQAS
jgi:hypothetical protein